MVLILKTALESFLLRKAGFSDSAWYDYEPWVGNTKTASSSSSAGEG